VKRIWGIFSLTARHRPDSAIALILLHFDLNPRLLNLKLLIESVEQ
jgi:hypothetical protein